MAQVETCSRCGTELVPGGNFCGSCGAPVDREPEPPAGAEPDDGGWVTFSGMPAVDSETDEGQEPDPFADAEDDAAANAPSQAYPPVAPTVLGMPAIRPDEPPAEESQPAAEPAPEPEQRREEYEVAPTVLGMPAIVMPEPHDDEPAAAADPAEAADVAEAPLDDPDLDPELEAEIEAMRAAARAQEEEAQRQAEEAARREDEEAAAREAEAAALREAQVAAQREAEEAAAREAQEREAREAEEREAAEAAAREAEAAEAQEAGEVAAAEAEAAAEEAEAEEAEAEQAEADVLADTEADVEPAADAEPDAGAELELELDPDAEATEPEAEPVLAGRTADDHLGEAFPPYAVFRAHVGRLDEFVHLAAFDPAGRAADTLRRSGFVLLWTAFDAFVRDTFTTLVERHPAALLAAADADAAVPYGELLDLSDGLTSLDGLRAGLVARELDRVRGRAASVLGTIELLTETFGFQDAPLPAAYLLEEESRTLDAEALGVLESRRNALVHEDGESVTSEEFVDAEAALATVAVKIAGTIAAGRYTAPGA